MSSPVLPTEPREGGSDGGGPSRRDSMESNATLGSSPPTSPRFPPELAGPAGAQGSKWAWLRARRAAVRGGARAPPRARRQRR